MSVSLSYRASQRLSTLVSDIADEYDGRAADVVYDQLIQDETLARLVGAEVAAGSAGDRLRDGDDVEQEIERDHTLSAEDELGQAATEYARHAAERELEAARQHDEVAL